jgi:hypothetical protein
MKLDAEAAGRIAFETVGSAALEGNHVSLVENRDAECAPGSPLAIETVAHRDLSWAAVAAQFNIPAMTAGCARFHKFLPGETLFPGGIDFVRAPLIASREWLPGLIDKFNGSIYSAAATRLARSNSANRWGCAHRRQ